MTMKKLALAAALCALGSTSAAQDAQMQASQSLVVLPKASLGTDFRPDVYFYGHSSAYRFAEGEGKKPVALAGLGSIAVPGLGQAINGQWVKTGVFATIEGLSLYGHIKNRTLGRDLERDYWNYVETGWSAAKYVGFLVDYHNHYYPSNPISYNDYATAGSNLAAIIESGNFPSSVRTEWPMIDLIKLRQLEAMTLYGGTNGTAFSHNLPDYGSQQYYELVSKYFQFGPGWKDFTVGVDQVDWEITGMSQDWLDGAAKSKRFNDRLRTARNLASLVFVNHLAAGVDALISAKLHNNRIETAFSPQDGGTLHLSVRF